MQKAAFLFVAALALMLLATSPLAAQTDNLELMNTGAGYVMGGVYTSPYGISVDGTLEYLILRRFHDRYFGRAKLDCHSNYTGGYRECLEPVGYSKVHAC